MGVQKADTAGRTDDDSDSRREDCNDGQALAERDLDVPDDPCGQNHDGQIREYIEGGLRVVHCRE